ncbi:MAG: methylenetetrahydrofolate--tRNA-(uracil(54)-C(5))-methyltransferase (FADH(2)-oxidizing) TrmFO [Candidatus Fermentibacteraceae bacterium]
MTVVGAGLAGSEAAWQLARAGISVELVEMRPQGSTPAHTTGRAAELVCSNSLRSQSLSNAAGVLKEELRRAGSLLIDVADRTSVPAGMALAVDRDLFSAEVQSRLEGEPLIDLVRREQEEVPAGRAIVASGPLTAGALASGLVELTGVESLYFYDAIAPVVDAESIDRSVAFLQSRHEPVGEGDYLNCPLYREGYEAFVEELLAAEKVPLKRFEREIHFAGCMPVEAIAEKGWETLAHGPMRPVGITDPRTGKQPFAVLQLRMENRAGTAWNMVGFQTKLTYPEQRRVFRMIPGLERAEFLRYGSMHRNTFVDGPAVLDGSLRLRSRPEVCLAGQITGVEGYIESIASGFLAAAFTAADLRGEHLDPPPGDTALGSLLAYATRPGKGTFQPSNINFGLFPPIEKRMRKRERRTEYGRRALESIGPWLDSLRRVLGPLS